MDSTKNKAEEGSGHTPMPDSPAAVDSDAQAEPRRPSEIGGRGGPDPTRYGDWEKGGRCIDF